MADPQQQQPAAPADGFMDRLRAMYDNVGGPTTTTVKGRTAQAVPPPPPTPGSGLAAQAGNAIQERNRVNAEARDSYAAGGQVGMQTGVPAQTFANMYSYAGGGQVGGAPGLQPQQGASNLIDPQTAEREINAVASDPAAKQQIQQAVQQAMQSGELDPQLVHLAVQLCKAVLQNPAMWPQLRQFAIQKGLAGPNDLPEQYDQGLVLAILTAAKAAEGAPTQQGGQPGASIQPPPGMGPNSGGMLQGPGTGTSDSIPAKNLANGGQVNVSNGEYVIPARVVAAKGKDFFDGLVRKYAEVP